jgi:hypothetical protein
VINSEVLAAVITAAAAAIGIPTLFIRQWLADKRVVNQELLVPAFNFAVELPEKWPWGGLGELGWKQLDPYRRLKIPAKYRQQLSELQSRIDAHEKLYARYFEFMGASGRANFSSSVQGALSKYVSADGSTIRAKDIGLEGEASIQVQWITEGALPYVLMNPGAPERAWDQLEAAGPGLYYWSRQATMGLRKVDPQSLRRLFESIESNSEAVKALPLVKSLYESFELVAQQSRVVSASLGARLGIKRALAS